MLMLGSGTGQNTEAPTTDEHAAVILGPRIGITVLFGIGFIYFCLVLNTFRAWSGVTVSTNNDTVVNFQSPDINNGRNQARGSSEMGQSPPIRGKDIEPVGTRPGGIEALSSMNVGGETREQRIDDIARGLEGGEKAGSSGGGSMLGLDPGPERSPPFRRSPNLLLPTLTSTPPRIPGSDLLNQPNTIVTQPIPINQAPPGLLTATDARMDPNGPWGLQDPIPSSSPPFTRQGQTFELDDGLPDRHTPPSNIASVYATPAGESVSEFGTLSQAGRRIGRGS